MYSKKIDTLPFNEYFSIIAKKSWLFCFFKQSILDGKEKNRILSLKVRDSRENHVRAYETCKVICENLKQVKPYHTLAELRLAYSQISGTKYQAKELPKKERQDLKLTFGDVFKAFYVEKEKQLKPTSFRQKVEGLYSNALSPYFDLEINQANTDKVIAEMQMNAHDKGVFLRGLKRKLGVMTKNEYLAEELMNLSALGELDEISPKNDYQKKCYDEKEVRDIISHYEKWLGLSHDFVQFIKWMSLSGMRPGEILGLERTAVSLVDGEISIHQQMSRELNQIIRTKTGGNRVFFMSEELKRLYFYIIKHSFAMPNCNLVFQFRGTPLNQQMFNRYWNHAYGISYLIQKGILNEFFPLYNLRHSFINTALSKGNDPHDVARQVGHSISTANKHYKDYSSKGKKALIL